MLISLRISLLSTASQVSHVKEISCAAHPVLPVLLVRSAASAGCGSYFPAGSAGLPLLPVQRVHGRCPLRFLPLREWEDCSDTRSPYDSTRHPCRSLAPDGNEVKQEFLEIRVEFSTDKINTSEVFLCGEMQTSCAFVSVFHWKLNVSKMSPRDDTTLFIWLKKTPHWGR